MLGSLNKDNEAIMPISLIMISIMCVSVILFILMVSITHHHPLQTKTMVESIAASLYQSIQSVDSSCIETHIPFYVNDLSLPISIQFFSNSMKITTTGSSVQVCVVKKSVIPWWIQTNASFWSNSTSFHQYLHSTYGHYGTIADPLFDNTSMIKNQLDQWHTNAVDQWNINPYVVDMSQPLHMEKMFIYYQNASDITGEVESQSFMLLYQ